MSSLGQLNIQLSLDAVQFQQHLKRSEQQARSFANRTVEYLNNIEQAAKNINRTATIDFRLDNLNRLKSVGLEFIALADKNTELANKIKLVTENERQQAQAMSAVYDISMKTAQSTQAVSAVYQSFAQNAKELGINQREVAEVTEIISKAVAISGASTSEAQNALTQFSQTLLMGKMRAQEYNSIMTQTPAVMQAIARGLGLTMGELKAMSDDGKLTTDKMIKGLQNAKVSVDELYGKTSTTISGAMQNLSTAAEKLVGELDSTLGLSQGVSSAINGLANNMGTLIPYVTNVGLAFAGIQLSKHTTEIYRKIQADRQQALTAIQVIKTNEAKITSELNATRAYIQSLQAQMNLTRVESTRALLSRELQAQVARETALIQAQTAATTQLATAKKAANMFSGALTALGGPVGIVTMGLMAGATWLYNWYQEAEQAKQHALDFVNQLDELNGRLNTMSSLELKVSSADTRNSIDEQKKKIQELEKELDKLEKKSNQKTYTVTIDFATGQAQEFIKNAATQQAEMDAVVRKSLELKQAKDNLAKSEESLAKQMEALPVAQLKEELAALFPNVEQSQIKVDGLNVSIGNLTIALPEATAKALEFSGTLGGLATSAIQAAVAVANLNQVSGGAIGEKAQAFIENNRKRVEIARLRKAGKHDEADNLQASLDIAGQKFEGADYDAALKSQIELLKSNRLNAKLGGSKNPNGTKTKSNKAEKAAERALENYQHQFSEMSNRLAGLKASIGDISLFGQVSDYQEVKKLTEDIVLNAEKYKSYGVEGLEKLKALAEQLDSAQQQVAIAQFAYNNNDKLKSMGFELMLLGKTRQEQELLQYNYKLEQEATRIKIGMSEENIALLDKELEKLKAKRAEIQAIQEQDRISAVAGFKSGLQAISDDVTNVNENIKNITVNAFDSMADSLNELVMTGKADFRSLATSILSDINKMIIKMMIFKAIQSAGSAMGFDISFIKNIGFATGGYTGDGGKYTPAGIVHKGEYVITKEATARLGKGYLDYLNYGKRGFASGGGVAVPTVPSHYQRFSPSQSTNSQISININVDSQGNTESTMQTAEQAKQMGKAIEAKVIEVLVAQKRNGNLLSR